AIRASDQFKLPFSIQNCVGALFNSFEYYDNRINRNNWEADGYGGPGYFGLGGASYATTGTSPFIFNTTALIDHIEIYSPTQSVMLQLSVDGVMYLLDQPDPDRSNSVMNVYMVTLNTPSTPSIQVMSTDGSRKALLAGMIAYCQTDGACVVNCGVGGSSTNDWTDPRCQTNLSHVLECYQPDLIIQNICINNHWHSIDLQAPGSGTDSTLYGQQLQILDSIYKSCNVPVLYYTPNAASPDMTPVSTQSLYCDVLRQMCIHNNRPLYDLYNHTQSYDYMVSQGWAGGNDPCHPTPVGYKMIATEIFNRIL
ncbi:MAG: SGNH/GDSL hydrolase family protein, partial [Sphingobacteriaceae bacterium]